MSAETEAPRRFAYADPPYLGCGRKLYGEHHAAAADWDDKATHLALIARMTADYPDGWALSCLARDLVWVLPACPDDVRIASWVKPFGSGYKPGQRIVWSWEPVVFRTVRTREPGTRVRDTLTANATQQRGLPGVKPRAFNRWVSDLLGYEAGDTLDDLFPGSGGMGHELAQMVLTEATS